MNSFICLWLSNYDTFIWEHFRIWMINHIQLLTLHHFKQVQEHVSALTGKLHSLL